MQHVLFTSLRDASRGPLAAALFNAVTDPTKARATSAGFLPAQSMHPVLFQALRELELEPVLIAAAPRPYTDELLRQATLTIHIGHPTGSPIPDGQLVWRLPSLRPDSVPRIHQFRAALELQLIPLAARRGWLSPSLARSCSVG